MSRTAVTQQHTSNSDVTACCVLLFVKCEVYRCEFLEFLVYTFISLVLFIGNFNFSSQYVLLGLTSCNTSNIVYYTAILCHKLVLLLLVRLIVIKNFIARLIAIKIFNRSAALIWTHAVIMQLSTTVIFSNKLDYNREAMSSADVF